MSETTSWMNVWPVVLSGSDARGKCTERMSPWLPMMERAPRMIVCWRKWKTKMPMTRNAMKFLIPRLVCSSRPKMR